MSATQDHRNVNQNVASIIDRKTISILQYMLSKALKSDLFLETKRVFFFKFTFEKRSEKVLTSKASIVEESKRNNISFFGLKNVLSCIMNLDNAIFPVYKNKETENNSHSNM